MQDTTETDGARALWQHIEPIHAVVYFAPEIADGFAETGLEGWWSGYFAARAAPLGAVGPEVVEATFYGFAPSLVRRAVPYTWTVLSPRAAIQLRQHRVGLALARLLGDLADDRELERIAVLLETAIGGAELPGRALYAANRSLDRPEDPLERVWHGCTLLREHRGDGHNAALLAAGLDGIRANRLAAGVGVLRGIDDQRRIRGWTEEEWDTAALDLADRGWVDADGVVTDEGRVLRSGIEHTTDSAATGPVRALGAAGLQELIEALAPLVTAVVDSGTVVYPNPIGLTPPGT